MALSALAGPVSNVLLAVVFTGLFRLALYLVGVLFPIGVASGMGFNVMSIVTYMLYLGIIINLGYAIFNLIPIPPLDGSRIAYVFLPPKWYFGVMRYERVIMLVMLLLLWFGPALDGIYWLVGKAMDGLFTIFGFYSDFDAWFSYTRVMSHMDSLTLF